MRAAVVSELGAPDIIVDNAVIQYTWTRVLDQSPADYESQFRSCVLHNVLMAQTFVPAMIARRWAREIGEHQITVNHVAGLDGERERP